MRARRLEKLNTIIDFQDEFPKSMDKLTVAYFNCGADDGDTVQRNRDAFKKINIRPQSNGKIECPNLSTTIFGSPVSFPVGISPTALNCMAHPDGELATVEAASSFGTIFILSLNSTKSIEEVAAKAPKLRKFLQLPLVSRDIANFMIKKAEAYGFEGIVLSIDTVTLGKRPELLKHNFTLPEHMRMPNLDAYAASLEKKDGDAEYQKYSDKWFEKNYSWDHLTYLKSLTKLPIILKGIQTAEDAELALRYKADAVFVSNHGGRQLDTGIGTIEILPEIVAAVGGRLPIFLDGGVMGGDDVFKALAIGANMVFLGRPILWGLGLGGSKGVKKVLQIYKEELTNAMATAGANSVENINSSQVSF